MTVAVTEKFKLIVFVPMFWARSFDHIEVNEYAPTDDVMQVLVALQII